MTIPSRPAPAPPGSRGQNAAAGANASLEQLRLQLQQQHLQQQQQSTNGGLQKLSIKLPPPPKLPQQQQRNHNNNFYDKENNSGTVGTSITRKFPAARYTAASNWNEATFGQDVATKKMPPPRPPPPKLPAAGRLASGGTPGLIGQLFQRKKTNTSNTTSVAATKAATQNRVYNLSSGQMAQTTVTANSTANNYDWNAAWNATTSTTTQKTSNSYQKEAVDQLISFDSPPSSPTFTQKSNSDCVSVDSFSSDSNFSSPNNGSVSQPESGFEDDYIRSSSSSRVDPWESIDNANHYSAVESFGSAPVRQLQTNRNPLDNPLCNGRSLLPPTQSLNMPTIIKPKISQKPKAPKPPPFIAQPPQMFNYAGNGFGFGFTSDSTTPPSPPMPKVAPPPLSAAVSGTTTSRLGAASNNISLLDVISGKVDALALSNGCSGYVEETELPFAIALYDFDGVEEGDLNFREGEKIYLLEQPTEEWFRGRTRSGCEGLFPVNYVEVRVPLEGQSQQQQQQQQPQQQSQQQQQQQYQMSRCLYNFPGEVEGDLALRENELVNVLYRINEDWLYGEVDGRQGQFPANFLEQQPENVPTL